MDWRKKIDKRFYDTVFAESTNQPDEVKAVAGAFFRQLENGKPYEKMLLSSSAYRKKSPQYKLASTGAMNAYESKVYDTKKALINDAMYAPIPPWTNFENVNAFGEPSWAGDFNQHKDIGRQRFYWKE